MGGKPNLFLRQSSGLVREVGPLAALLMNTAYITYQSGYLLLISSIVNFPFGNPILALILGFITFAPMAYLINFIGSTYYRTASDYVFMSRNLEPRIGFASLLMFTVDQMFFNAVSMVFALTTALGPSLYAIAVSLGDKGLVNVANLVTSNPVVIFTVGAIMLAVIILINMVSVKAGKYLSSAISLIATVTFILTMIILYLYGGELPTVINSIAPGFYGKAIEADLSLPKGNVIYGTIALLPYMAYIFPYTNFIITIGGEVKREAGTVPLAVIGTYVLITVLVGFGLWATIGGLGLNFINGAFAVYYGLVPNVSWPSNMPPPYPPALAILLIKNPVMQWIIAIGSLTWYINSPSTIVLQIARYLFAMSFDRILPGFIAYVNPRTHTPVIAHGLDLAISLIIMYLYVFSVIPALSATMDISTVVTILMYFIILSITAVAYGVKRRNTLITIIGLYLTGYFTWVSYMEVSNPLVYLFTPITSALIFAFFIAVFAAGVIIFEVARYIRARREGIDLMITFKEIPPE
ncbi:APC family permease [Caldivirga maquilingensis]|uniref:Amino acid permease-associated region n=1 Tax=Caldivirga maquilingensis (strain ATCC 700844 / DSM 13496 / JCM 10307 / IC-167) TaxID=397948 RepID=A8MAF4_CALMQ|nr:APC family permease [Caldivirga maquilingensis]ABW02531.1 amino acid permease-associated region [Caldivirga maquilingensis IC-167]